MSDTESIADTLIGSAPVSDIDENYDSKITYIIYQKKQIIEKNLQSLNIEIIKQEAKLEVINNILEEINEYQYENIFENIIED